MPHRFGQRDDGVQLIGRNAYLRLLAARQCAAHGGAVVGSTSIVIHPACFVVDGPAARAGHDTVRGLDRSLAVGAGSSHVTWFSGARQ